MAQENFEVMRQYAVLPAIEQTKILIIERLKVLFDGINILFQQRLQNKKDDEIIALVKSSTITLYLLLKPKIIEHVVALGQRTQNPNNPVNIDILKSLFNMEKIMTNPMDLSIEQTIQYADIINLFCHEYGVTKITYFAGTQVGEKNIYNV